MFQLKMSGGAILAAVTVMSHAQPGAALPATAPATATTVPAATPAPPAAPMFRPVTPAPPAAVPAVPGGAVPAVPSAAPAAPDPRADDDTFLLLREASRQNDAARANALASRLTNYALPSYVEYYRLKPRLGEAPLEEIRAFLQRYQGSAIADTLRSLWLLELGRKRDWINFDHELPRFIRNDDLQIKCYALLSRMAKGERVADDARALLRSPPAYGEGCAALLAQLALNNQFTQADLLNQLRLAGEMSATGPARRTAQLLRASDLRAAQAVDLPALAMARGIGTTRVEHEIYLVAIGRMARTSLKLATVALEKNSPKLTPEERAIGWSNVALAASIALDPQAADYWQRAEGAPLSREQLQWKTRIALRRADWKGVQATIEAMPADLRAESGWTYWLGRALEAQNGSGKQAARALFERIADQHSFYGQLALEELGQLVSAPPAPTAVTPAELALAAANPDLQRALRLFALRLRADGTREWNWALRDFNDRQLLAAAEFARRNAILDRMVYTSERTRTELDYTQRYPAPHDEILHPTAKSLSVDRAWVYGLIRQESRFITEARSGVGASGLMQVMPATGKWVASKIGLTDFVHDALSEVRTNITLGINYMNMVLTNVDGSQVLASIAYNAGPSRARNWRGTLSAPMEGAVFVESIPFSETRTYVRNVMSNATNYAALFDQKPQSLKARLGTIAPRAGSAGLP